MSVWPSVKNLLFSGVRDAVVTPESGTPADPRIIQQPASTTVNAGTSPTLSVIAAGTGTLTYQWRKWVDDEPEDIEGAESSTFELAEIAEADAGDYDVVVTGDLGSVTSNRAAVTVNAANNQPTDIALSSASIDEGNSINDVIGSLTTTDADLGDSHTYSLVAGTGDTDNASFNISGSSLRAGEVFDYATKSSYSIRIQTNDGNGGTFAKQFTITVNEVAPIEYDYVVTDNAEFDAAVAAQSGDEWIAISGTNFTQPTISKSGLRITSLNSSSKLPSIAFSGTVNGFESKGLNFQMSGWPADHNGCVEFGTGTFSNLVFDGGTWRHGYGVDHDPFDMEFEYDEYERVDNVETATTSSATYALDWLDPTATRAVVYFFNRGASDVYVKLGGSGVTASTSDTLVPAGSAYVKLSNVDPTSDTHWAVISVSGTPEVNCRTEIGFSYYLADAFVASGSSNISNLTIKNIQMEDLNNGAKGWGTPSGYVYIVDNDFKRIYQDIVSGALQPSSTMIVARNVYDVPFARSGIAEDLFGDAADPHGDWFQLFSVGAGTIGPVYSAGNRARVPAMRSGVTSQGIFWTDNDASPSYDLLFAISETIIGGGPNAITYSGEAPYPIENGMIYGCTVINPYSLDAGTLTAIRVATGSEPSGVSVDKSIVSRYVDEFGQIWSNNTLLLSDAADVDAVFPDITDLLTATNRAEIEAALTPAEEGAGLGAAATADAIDWTTTDPTAIILWENVASGVAWNDVTEVDTSTVYTFPLRRVMNRRASQAVVAGSGVEWRSVDTDGTTEIQGWTSSSGTIGPDEYIQIRKTSSASALTEVTATVTINGFDVSPTITTSASLVDPFRMDGTTYFQDTANCPANTTVLEWEIKANISSFGSSSTYFTQVISCAICQANASGSLIVNVEDAAGATKLNSGVTAQTIPSGQVITLNFKVDFDNLLATVAINGTQIYSGAITDSPGQNSFQTNRKIAFGGSTLTYKANTDVEYFKVWRTTSGVRTLHKEISVAALGSIANINSDAWKVGGTITATP